MADLVTRSRLDDSDFNRGLARMRKEARDFNKKLGSEFAKVFSGAALGTGLVAGLYAAGRAITGLVSRAGRINDLAEALNEMPAELAAVGGAAALMGADMDAVNRAAVKLRVNLGKVTEGDKEMTETMKIMGLNARELSQMPLPDMMVALSRGFQKADASGKGYMVTQALLGRGASDLIGLLRKSPEELLDIFADLKPKSNEAIQALDDLGDAFERLKMKAGNAATSYLGGFAMRVLALKKSLSEKGLIETAKGMMADYNPNPFVPSEQERVDFSKGRPKKTGGVAFDAEGGDTEKQRKEIDRLTDAYWRAKEARDAANRTDEQNLENLIGRLAELRNRIAQGNADQAQSLRLRTEEQGLMKEIEDLGRKIGEQKKRDAEEDKREKEKLDKLREDKMSEGTKQRELALEVAIAKLKVDGKDHAVEEARLRLAAAEKEYDFARGSKREAEAYVALLAARNNLTEATGASQGKSKNERIEDYMRDGLTAGEAKKRVRGEDRDARKADARINAFRRGAEESPNLMGEGVRDYMDSHRNVAGAKAFDSGAWESGSHGQAVADAAAGKGIEGASGGDANGMGQLLQAVQELKQAIEKASGGS